MVESRWWVFTIKFNQHFCFNTVRIKHPGNKISPTDQKAQPGLTITGLSHNPNWHMRELWTTEVMLSAPTLTGERAESAHEPGWIFQSSLSSVLSSTPYNLQQERQPQSRPGKKTQELPFLDFKWPGVLYFDSSLWQKTLELSCYNL